jgi:putative tricarboxylic transport membrane protein
MTVDVGFVLGEAFSLTNLVLAISGVVLGTVIGALPGLSATMAIAILVPFTFTMDPASALIMLGAIYTGAIYGGAFAAILVNTPGTPSAIATTFDGYPMAKRGDGDLAVTLASPCQRHRRPHWRHSAAHARADARPAGAGLPLDGVFLAGDAGTDADRQPVHGEPAEGPDRRLLRPDPVDDRRGRHRRRHALHLRQPDAARRHRHHLRADRAVLHSGADRHGRPAGPAFAAARERSGLSPGGSAQDLRAQRLQPHPLQSIIGTLVGILPGAGGSIASLVSYSEARRASRTPERFGKGEPGGLLATESANNATVGGGFIPTLVLGIPGTPPDAVILGALLVQGIRVGPELFTQHGGIVYVFMVGLLIATCLMLPTGLFIGRYAYRFIVDTPKAMLVPLVAFMTVLGSFAIHANPNDVLVMVVMGVMGWLLSLGGYSVSPIVLGLILGQIAEQGFMRAYMIGTARGDFLGQLIVNRPISWGIVALIAITLFVPLIRQHMIGRGSAGGGAHERAAAPSGAACRSPWARLGRGRGRGDIRRHRRLCPVGEPRHVGQRRGVPPHHRGDPARAVGHPVAALRHRAQLDGAGRRRVAGRPKGRLGAAPHARRHDVRLGHPVSHHRLRRHELRRGARSHRDGPVRPAEPGADGRLRDLHQRLRVRLLSADGARSQHPAAARAAVLKACRTHARHRDHGVHGRRRGGVAVAALRHAV